MVCDLGELCPSPITLATMVDRLALAIIPCPAAIPPTQIRVDAVASPSRTPLAVPILHGVSLLPAVGEYLVGGLSVLIVLRLKRFH